MDKLATTRSIPSGLTENRLLQSSKLLTSSLASYQRSTLVSTKSSVLESKTANLFGSKDLLSKSTGEKTKVDNELLKSTEETKKEFKELSKPAEEKKEESCGPVLETLLETVSRSVNVVSSSKRSKTHEEVLTKGKRVVDPCGRNLKISKLRKESTGSSAENLKHKEKKEKEASEAFSEDVGDSADVAFVIPNYNLDANYDQDSYEISAFLPPDKDHCILRSRISASDPLQPKRALVNAASASLIQAPNFKNSEDSVRLRLMEIADRLLSSDPEFVLKVALYTRCELNIRTTANFLLAYAANRLPCRQYLQKYFKATICLPSDWIEVAEIYQEFHDKNLKHGSLPTALRKVMLAKFPDFDKYQLSKYNKENSRKKKNKKNKKLEEKEKTKPSKETTTKTSDDESSSEEEEEEEDKNKDKILEMKKKGEDMDEGENSEARLVHLSFTMKQLIRKLHITEPVEHVMCLIGKRYPSTLDEFYQKRLPGMFEEERAGKRMKLPTAETWETQVSLKGNKASTWEDLIDHKKLPFMAMLRNLRNLIKAGISDKHHSWVINKLCEEGAVTHSKQFPFRFFSAYEVLGELEKELKKAEEGEEKEEPVAESLVLKIAGVMIHHAVPSSHSTDAAGRGRGNARRGSLATRGRGRGGRVGRGGAAGCPAAARGRGGKVSRGGSAGRAGADRRGRGGRARGGGGRAIGGGRGSARRTRQKSEKAADTVLYNQALLTRYQKALDTAVKIATVHNIKPIRGTTIILCSLCNTMTRTPCTSARGLGKPRTLAEVAVLLGLMCKSSSERCQFVVYGSGKIQSVELEKGTILYNMERVLKLAEIINDTSYQPGNAENSFEFDSSQTGQKMEHLIEKYLTDILMDRTQLNNVIVLTDQINPGQAPWPTITKFVEKYRMIVDPDLLFVGVSLGRSKAGFSDDLQPAHENDIFISGFSDQLLRFIAERGEGAQLVHVNKIDEAYSLKPMPKMVQQKPLDQRNDVTPEKPLPIVSLRPKWRTARVFISSTFRDMHGERDLMTRFVFPELRSRAEKRFISIYEVDLRWGISEEDARSKRTLELCLTQVFNCQLFVGILGDRYGWVPTAQDIPQMPQFDWVFEHLGASVSELEMYAAALSSPSVAAEKAFFFIRDNSFLKDVPKQWRPDFTFEDENAADRLGKLKSQIRASGVEVYDGYPCYWGGVAGEKPVVAGLNQFGVRVMNNLWNAVEKLYPYEDDFLDEATHERSQHENFFASLHNRLIGRKVLLNKAFEMLKKTPRGLVMVHGKAGSGKSSVMAALVNRCIEEKLVGSGLDVLVHCVGAAPGSTNVVCLLRRICHELRRRLNSTSDPPNHFKNLVDCFHQLLEDSSEFQAGQTPLLIFLDGVDLLEDIHDAPSLNWLPEKIPQNVVLVVSVRENSVGQKSLLRRADVMNSISVDFLDAFDKAQVVQQILSTHAKRLDDSPFNNQLKILISKRESSVPLYLSLACEEIRVFGIFEKVTQKLHSLPHTLTQLLNESLSRIESDNGTRLVALSLSLLLCSRNGLEGSELRLLLSLDHVLSGSYLEINDIRNVLLKAGDMMPSITILRLIRSLEKFLRPVDTDSYDSALLSLDQQHVRSVIQQRYTKGPSAIHENDLHRLLAGYYYTVADPERNGCWSGKIPKAFSELPYHLACAGCYNDLGRVLCDLLFIRAKCQLGLSVPTLSDFSPPGASTKALEQQRMKLLSDSCFQDYQNFVSRNLHVLSSHPVLTIQQALNEPSHARPAADAKNLLSKSGAAGATGAGLMQWLNKPEDMDCCVRTVGNLPEVVTCVALSSSGTLLAVALRDCTVKLYELQPPSLIKELKMFSGHSNFISSLCFVSNSRLCSASADGTLSLWSITGGHRISVLRGHGRLVSGCASDPSGKVIVSVGWDFAIKIWNGQTGASEGNLSTDQRPVNCVAFHPEGQLIVTGDWDSTLKLWDVFHKSRKGVLRGHCSSVRDVAFSPSGRHIASASLDGEVKIWSAVYGSSVGAIHGHSLPINCLAFSPTGQELVTASDDKKVKVWSGNIGRPLNHIGLKKNYGPVVCVTFDATGERVAAGFHEGFVRVFTVSSGVPEWEKSYFLDPTSICCIKYKNVEEVDFKTGAKSTSSIALFVGNAKGSILMLDESSGQVKCTLEAHSKSVMAFDLCRRSRSGFVVTASEDCTVQLFEYSKLEKNERVTKPEHVLVGHTGPVTCCALNEDETKLATGSRDKNVIVWNLGVLGQVTQERILFSCHNDWVTCCAWSETGKFLVTGSNDFNLKLWDVDSGSEKVKFTGHLSTVSSVAYKYGCIVSSCNDGSVKVWSHKGAEVTTLHGHLMRANGCAIHFDIAKEAEMQASTDWATMVEEENWQTKHEESKVNKSDVRVERVIVASCSDDGTVRLWLPLESSELACLTGHAGKVLTVACGQSGFVCSAGLDRTMKFWRVTETASSASFGHGNEVTAIACSQDGSTLLTAGRDGTMKVWSTVLPVPDGTSTGIPQLLLTIQVSKKSVNCVQFIGVGSNLVLSGSDDCIVSLWALSLCTNPHAKKLESLTLSSPVSSFAVASPTLRDTPCNVFVTLLSLTVLVLTVDNRSAAEAKRSRMKVAAVCKGHSDWCLTSSRAMVDGQVVILTGGADGQILSWKPELLFQDAVKQKIGKSSAPTVKPFDVLSTGVSGAWVTCISTSGKLIYSGDSSGNLTVWEHDPSTRTRSRLSKTQIHVGKLTSIVCLDDLIFTASTDKAIKVWNRNLKQIGQFFCKAPVTSLCLEDANQNQKFPKQHRLVCGNELGEVLFLNWMMS